MPVLPFEFGDALVRGSIQTAAFLLPEADPPKDLAPIQSRFPNRDVAALPRFRQIEHWAVHEALSSLDLPCLAFAIGHTADGAPHFTTQPSLDLSISHSRHPYLGTVAMVAVADKSQTKGRLGIDVEFPRSTLNRVAPRIFSQHEIALAQTENAACMVWCLKEAAWKGWGPDLDYRMDIGFVSEPGPAGRMDTKVLGQAMHYAAGHATGDAPWLCIVGPC